VPDPDHPLVQGLPTDLTLRVNGAVEPDTFNPINSTPIFVRGNQSADRGKAAVIAMEQNGYKAVLSAVPLQWFPEEERRTFLINVLNWFED